MSKPKDLLEIVATIRESIEASPRKSRKVRFHNLRSKFGWQAWTAQRKELVAQLLKDAEILAQPPIADARPMTGSCSACRSSLNLAPRNPYPRPMTIFS